MNKISYHIEHTPPQHVIIVINILRSGKDKETEAFRVTAVQFYSKFSFIKHTNIHRFGPLMMGALEDISFEFCSYFGRNVQSGNLPFHTATCTDQSTETNQFAFDDTHQ